MAAEQDGHSKGFAFVEFEEEVGASVAFIHEFIQSTSVYVQKDAQAALGANNYELKKRRIAVTLADSRVRARNRRVFLCFAVSKLNLIISPVDRWAKRALGRRRRLATDPFAFATYHLLHKKAFCNRCLRNTHR